jgi:hypothetical protein
MSTIRGNKDITRGQSKQFFFIYEQPMFQGKVKKKCCKKFKKGKRCKKCPGNKDCH